MTYTGEKKKEYDRIWVARRRADFFQDKTCKTCGSNEKLELHHRDPALKESHNIWSWSQVRREKELEKCDILCFKCHKEETIKFLSRPLIHGTNRCYDEGCRCEPCRALKSIRNKKRVRKCLP